MKRRCRSFGLDSHRPLTRPAAWTPTSRPWAYFHGLIAQKKPNVFFHYRNIKSLFLKISVDMLQSLIFKPKQRLALCILTSLNSSWLQLLLCLRSYISGFLQTPFKSFFFYTNQLFTFLFLFLLFIISLMMTRFTSLSSRRLLPPHFESTLLEADKISFWCIKADVKTLFIYLVWVCKVRIHNWVHFPVAAPPLTFLFSSCQQLLSSQVSF